jgi:CubicO group peptidase (beta-lactamase class C family)
MLILVLTRVQAQAPVPSEPALKANLLDAINGRFERFQRETHAPGLVWGIVADGRLIYVNAFGVQDIKSRRPVTAESVFRIASMSKAFTALALLKLRESGKLSLDDLLARYIPEAQNWQYPTSDSPKLRLIDLLGHTAGLGPDDPWSDRQQPMSEETFTALLEKGFSFNQAPQTSYVYSSLGYAILGRVITNISGLRYDQYVEQALMRPLGMTASGYEIADVPDEHLAVGYRWESGDFVRETAMANGAFGAMGGIHTSANDYARWVAFLLSAWPARDGAETGPVNRAVVRELAIGTSFPRFGTRQGPNGGVCAFSTVYGAGFNVVRDCDLGLLLAHNGGFPGYGSSVLLMPDYGVGIFAFVNRTYDEPTEAIRDAAQMLKQGGFLKLPLQPVNETLARSYQRAAAMYRAGDVRTAINDLAVNFLMDRSADNWSREFEDLKGEVGNCDAQEPIVATGRRTGIFTWQCAHGAIRGSIELSPTNPSLIQALTLDSSH